MEKHSLLPSLRASPTQDVYLRYEKEHYNSIVEVKQDEASNQILTFNITSEDIAVFVKIGASFHVTNPAEINSGKLYFVPLKDFCTTSNDSILGDTVKSSNTTEILLNEIVSKKLFLMMMVPFLFLMQKH